MRPIVDLRSLAMNGVLPPEELSLLSLAKALAAWHENTRCCGHCGGTTLIKDGGWRRKCWACGQDHFPRTDPVVIMLIVDPPNDRCLLGHEARFAENMWSTLAGFIEPGEDIETAVRRETMEETSIKVGEVRFISTQPWPFPHSLMIGCIGIAESSEIRIDPNEIVDARWFPREEVRQMLEGTHPKGPVGARPACHRPHPDHSVRRGRVLTAPAFSFSPGLSKGISSWCASQHSLRLRSQDRLSPSHEKCGRGGNGRRKGLKIPRPKRTYRFDPGRPHQISKFHFLLTGLGSPHRRRWRASISPV